MKIFKSRKSKKILQFKNNRNMVQKEYSRKTITNQIKSIKNREKTRNHKYQSKNYKKIDFQNHSRKTG